MAYWTIPLIAFGLLSVYLGVRMFQSEEFISYLVQAKWSFQGRLGVKLVGLKKG